MNRLIENYQEKLNYINDRLLTFNKMITITKNSDLNEKDKQKEIKHLNLMVQYLTKVKEGIKDGSAEKLIDFKTLNQWEEEENQKADEVKE